MSLDSPANAASRSRPSVRLVLWVSLVVLWATYGICVLGTHLKVSLAALSLVTAAHFAGKYLADRGSLRTFPRWYAASGLLLAIPAGLLLSLAIRMHYVLDYETFLSQAATIYRTGEYHDWYNTVAWRPPGPALLYGLPMLVGVSPQLSVWFVNSLLLTVLFAFVRACHGTDSPRSNLISIIATALILCLVALPFLILPITHLPAIVAMAGVLWLLPTSAASVRQMPPTRWFAVGSLTGVGTLFRANLILQFVVYCLSLLAALGPRLTRREGGRFLAACLACLGGILLVILPWSIRNWRVLHRPVLLSTQGGMDFCSANSPILPADQGRYNEAIHLALVAEIPDEVTRDRVAWRRGWDAIRRHPVTFVESYAYRIPRLLGDSLFVADYIGRNASGSRYALLVLNLVRGALLIAFWSLWWQFLVSARFIRQRVFDPENLPWPQVSLLLVLAVSSLFECVSTYQWSLLPFIMVTWLGSPDAVARRGQE